MLSSSDVSALFASQNAQFGQRSFFQVTTGAYDPTSMGIGAVGAGAGSGGFIRQQPMAQGVAPPPPVFSYGQGGYFGPGGGAGNAFAGRAMAGLGAGAALGGIGLGLASMTGRGAFLSPFVDPISSAIGGFARGGVMGAAGAAALPLALGMGASAAVGSVIHGGQQQQAMHQQVGQFSFVNPMARGGQGFTRQDASSIASSIRDLAHVPEMLTSVEELTRLLPKMRSMGIMQGVKDTAEFQKRFKETITTVRDMSRMLGTTMEEAAEFFQHSRMSGFTSKRAQLGNVLNAQYTSAMTGMSMGSTMQMQAGGAAMARQFGGRGRYGAAGVTNIAQRLQSGVESGALEEGLLTDMTGLEGSEAVRAGSEMMYGTMLGLSKTAPGRLIMAGAMKRGEGGKVELDREILAKLNRGEMSANDLKARAGKLSDQDKMAFVRNAPTLGSQFAGQVDIGQFLQGLVGNKGPDAGALVLNNLTGGQLSEPQVSAMMQMSGQGPSSTDALNFANNRSREMKLRERTDPGMIWGRIKKKMHSSTFGALEDTGGKIYDDLGKAYENWIDDLVGRHVIALSKDGAESVKAALSGGGNKDVIAMFEAASGLRGTGGGGITNRQMSAAKWGAGVGMGILGAAGLAALTIGTGGLGALAIGGIAASGGAGAAIAAFGLGDSGNYSDSEDMGWWSSVGKDDTTGLSERGLRNRMARLTGVDGSSKSAGGVSHLDTMLKAADEGKLKTEAGEKARGSLGKLFSKLHFENSAMREGRADAGQREALGRGAIYEAIANAMETNTSEPGMYGQEGIASIGESADWLQKNQGKWTDAEWEDRAAKLEKGGKGDVAAIIRAGVSGRQKFGITDIATAAMMVSGQASDDFGIKLGEVGNADLVDAYSNVAKIDDARKDAVDRLSRSGLSSETQEVLKGSSSLRSAAAIYAAEIGTDKGEAIRRAVGKGDFKALEDLGIKISKADLGKFGSIMGDIQKNPSSSKDAIQNYDRNRKAEDAGAVVLAAKQTAAALRATAKTQKVKINGKDVDQLTAGGNLAEGIAGAMDAVSKARNGKEADAAFADLKTKTTEATAAYVAAGKKGGAAGKAAQADIVESMGTYGEDLATQANKLEGLLGTDKDGLYINLADAKLTEAEAKRAGAGVVKDGKARFDKESWKSFQANIVGGKLSEKAFSSGQAQTGVDTDKQMLEALKGIGKNSDLQAALLATLVNKEVKNGGVIVRDLTNASRSGSGTGAVDIVRTWDGVAAAEPAKK
jgi:hypothetical protein